MDKDSGIYSVSKGHGGSDEIIATVNLPNNGHGGTVTVESGASVVIRLHKGDLVSDNFGNELVVGTLVNSEASGTDYYFVTLNGGSLGAIFTFHGMYANANANMNQDYWFMGASWIKPPPPPDDPPPDDPPPDDPPPNDPPPDDPPPDAPPPDGPPPDDPPPDDPPPNDPPPNDPPPDDPPPDAPPDLPPEPPPEPPSYSPPESLNSPIFFDEPPVPLGEFLDIFEDDVPLAQMETVIVDDHVPLGAMPQTGLADVSSVLTSGLMASALIAAVLVTKIRNLKKQDEV